MSARKIVTFMFVCAVLMACTPPPAQAQPELNQLLAEMPAKGTVEGDRINEQLVALGHDAIVKTCGMLVAPGAGDDLNARFALSGLAKYVGDKGREAERRVVAAALLDGLKAASDDEVKAFLIRQLQLAGREEAVTPLSAYLADDRLCGPATQALLAIGTPAASDALAAALPGATGARRVTLITALGVLQNDSVASQILKDAKSGDRDLRWAALYALANMGVDEAEGLLDEVAASGTRYEVAKATSYSLLYKRRAAETGKADLLDSEEESFRCAALTSLVEAKGKRALDDLLDALDSDSRQVRARALELAAVAPGKRATKKWVKKMETAGPQAKMEIMAMLGQRGNKAALSALLEAVNDESPAVRLVAIGAATRLGGPKAVTTLLTRLEFATEDAEVQAVKAALLRVPGKEAMAAIARALPKVSPEGRVVLLEVLAARRATKQLNAVLAQTTDEEKAVRIAAVKALVNVGGTDELPRLVSLLLDAESKSEAKACVSTYVALAAGIEDAQARDDLLVEALANAPADKKGRVLGALSRVGGADALAATLDQVKNADAEIRDAAIRALANWPDAAAAAALLELARNTDELKYQVLALRGYGRLVADSRASDEEKVAMYRDGLNAAKRPEEKMLMLKGLGDVRTDDALTLVGECLADDALAGEAALAAVKIACPRNDKDKGLMGVRVAKVLTAALDAIEDDAVRQKVQAHIARMPLPDADGFVPLFNGKDLTGWVGDTKGYLVEDNMIVCKPGGNLYTAREYGDFVFRFEFKLTPGGNNGLAVRAPIGGGAYDGMELQILDNTADQYKNLQPYQYHGSIYGIVPAKRGFQKPVGEWNVQEVTAKGRRIKVVLNGTTIVDADLDEASTPATMDGKEHKGLDRAKGHLGFLGHGSVVWFRNLRIKELD
ncbi:MAG: DUF1080 domain-containing protein [Nitrospiraceae bacterium]|nr:DUF1080 domain-containing protein [Nitrospiraceae bacterium]